MGPLALPAIEAVATRVLATLGVGVVAGAAGEAAKEQARKRQEETDKAKSAPISKTDVPARTRKKCEECPPDRGTPFERSTAGWSAASIAYQIRIGQMPPAQKNGCITEWKFAGVDFDGFDSSQCLLKEAKARYDQFFDLFGVPEKWWGSGVDTIMKEMSNQSIKAIPRPSVRLEWFWQEPVSYHYFSKILGPIAPDVLHHYAP
jgi:hypothetical protein